MLEAITVGKVADIADNDSEAMVEVFDLHVGPIYFGHLYLAQETYTLTWDGTLDFKHIDDTAHLFLYKQLDYLKSTMGFSEKYKRKFSLEKYRTNVCFIVSNKLKKFHFDYSEEPDEYKKLLDDPDQISFARYDFQLRTIPFWCCLTAENPQGTSFKDRELAFLVPRTQPITKSLLWWIVKNHVSIRELKLRLDYHKSEPVLAEAISSGFSQGDQLTQLTR